MHTLQDCWHICAESCPTICSPKDCSLPVSSVHGIFQARLQYWHWRKGDRIAPSKDSNRIRELRAGKEGTASSVWTPLGSSDFEAALMKNKDPLGHSQPASCQTAHLIKVELAFSSWRTSLLWEHLLLQTVSGSDESARAVRWAQFRWLTPAFLPGKFHGQKSLVGYSP